MTRLRCATLGIAIASFALACAAAGPAPALSTTRDLPAAWAANSSATDFVDSRTVAAPETDRREQVPSPDGWIGPRKSYAIPAAEVLGFAILLNHVNRHTDGSDYDSNLSTIRRNLRSSWVVDSDPFKVNQLGHPYQGSIYHAFARSAGLDYWESLGYAFAGSALWEIAGERTPPSRND
jgi:hypothetical protein